MSFFDKNQHETLSVIGLGKVGLSLAACLAASGSTVTGYDPDLVRKELLNKHDPEQDEILFENGLSRALTDGVGKISTADDIASAILRSTISFIIVPTPSNEDGSFSLVCVEDACREIGAALRGKNGDHLIVLVSTVSPGSIVDVIIPLIEHTSGKTCGEEFSFCYSPALIALGNVIKGFLEPDFAFVGEVDRKGGDQLAAFYSNLLPAPTQIHRMSAQSVEIAKIALNNFLTMKVGFSNLIGHLCDRTANADAADVLGALGDDKRIGKKFLNAGMGFGGPCLPRDNDALAACFTKVGIEPVLPHAIARCNKDHTSQLASLATEKSKIAVLGLGYKVDSPVTLDSASIALCNALIEQGKEVSAFDALIDTMDLAVLHKDVVLAPTLREALQGTEIVFLTVDHKLFGKLHETLSNDTLIVDIYGGFKSFAPDKTVRTFGTL